MRTWDFEGEFTNKPSQGKLTVCADYKMYIDDKMLLQVEITDFEVYDESGERLVFYLDYKADLLDRAEDKILDNLTDQGDEWDRVKDLRSNK